MAQIVAMLPGQNQAAIAVRWLRHTLPPEQWPQTLLFLPTGRACHLLRLEFEAQLQGKAALLPRMLALADLASEWPTLSAEPALLQELAAIPPAMPEWLRLGLLMQQVQAFLRAQRAYAHGTAPMGQLLRLAQELAQIQDSCAQQGIALRVEDLRALGVGDDAAHWQASLDFLAIVAQHWPRIAAAHGMTTATSRQAQVVELLARHWQERPPTHPVLMIGSTGSQAPTAALMHSIAALPQGAVLLPGLDPALPAEEWASIAPGHAYYPMQRFLARAGIPLAQVIVPEDAPETVPDPSTDARRTLWREALLPTALVPQWRTLPPIAASSLTHLRVIACAQEEEEVRVATLLVREALESSDDTVAIITPDEDFMARVAAQLQRYGVKPNRLHHGTLLHTETGSLWRATMETVVAPERMLTLWALLTHPLIVAAQNDDTWQRWLQSAEPCFRGVMTHRPGQLPALPEALHASPIGQKIAEALHAALTLSRQRLLPSHWVAALAGLQTMLAPPLPHAQAAEAVTQTLAQLADADNFGAVDADGFAELLAQALDTAWRGDLYDADHRVHLLTPIEARMQHFDRIVLAGMNDDLWPGAAAGNAWLNQAHQRRLGLATPEERIGLMAHDLLLLGSAKQVFLTYACRVSGSPAAPSRFIERLRTMLAVRGLAPETLNADTYLHYAHARDQAWEYLPEPPVMPLPTADERPQKMAVSALEYLFSDPFTLYARYVLQLQPIDPFDALPEAQDFGSIAHRAIEMLVTHWNSHAVAASESQLYAIAEAALHAFSQRANVRLFWRTRLLKALAFVNAEEAARRQHLHMVVSEQKRTQTIQLSPTQSLTLQGRMDRLERDVMGNLRVIDYKTGQAASVSAMQQGLAVQVLAYALMLREAGEMAPIAVEYWGLPAGKRAGKITALEAETINNDQLLAQLRAGLATLMQPATPLLAHPLPHSSASRDDPTYDGISRYDEWCG